MTVAFIQFPNVLLCTALNMPAHASPITVHDTATITVKTPLHPTIFPHAHSTDDRNIAMNQYLSAVLLDDQTVNPVLRHLGIRVEYAEEGAARLRLDPSEHVAQGAGMMSGGVICTLLDEAMAHAVLSAMKTPRRTATIDMNVQFLKGSRPGSTVYGDATVVKYGNSVAFVRADAVTPEGTVVASATASFILC